MNTTDQARTMTAEQLVQAVEKAIHFSNAMDSAVRRPMVSADFERNWARLGAFITSLSMSLDDVSPGLFGAIAEFQEDVVFARNPLKTPAAPTKEQGQ